MPRCFQPLFGRAIAALLLSAVVAFGQEGLPAIAPLGGIDYEAVRLTKIVTAVRSNEKIAVDGRLEEPAWKIAIPATDFITLLPRPGEPSSERTEVRFVYDDNNLYIGFICFDANPKDNVVVLRKDFQSQESDGVSITIDSLHDRRTGFQFGTNPAGAKRDSQISNNGTFNNDWEGAWDVKVTVNDESWIAEFVIPFKTLRFTKETVQEWGVNLSRFIVSKNEQSFWSPIPVRFSMARISLSGTLNGLEGIHQGRNLKVKPFTTAGFTQARTVNGTTKTDTNYDGGVDLKYSVTPSLTLDGTYRTDFAQVEVDQQQVNLTRFNLFFPEKRDFFLENAGIFTFGAGIGNQSASNLNLIPFFSRSIGLSGGSPVPILGGARLTGRTGKYDVGVLDMRTETGTDGTRAIPANNFFVGRVKRNFSTTSWIGALATNRNSTIAGDYNRVYGPDAHFQFFNKLDFDGYFLKSDTPGKSGRNQARRFGIGWRDDELVFSTEYNAVQSNFNPEMGFITRKDNTNYGADFSWLPLLRHSKVTRNLIFGATTDYYQGGNGRIQTRVRGVSFGAQFQNSGNITFAINRNFDRLVNKFAIRPNLAIAPGDYTYKEYLTKFQTSQKKKIGGNGTVSIGQFWNGHRKSVTGTLTARPNYHLNTNLDYGYNNVTLPNGSFTSNLVGLRLLYGFTPKYFFNAYVQYNSLTHQVSSNLRFDIVHHPLSDLYIIYNDTRDTLTGQFRERELIVKLTNLFSF